MPGSENNPVRVIDVFVDELDLGALGFGGVNPEITGRPSYHPSVLLKLYIYGYLNRVQSSRRLEREAARNVEMMWLTGRLTPDHKTSLKELIAYVKERPGQLSYGSTGIGATPHLAFEMLEREAGLKMIHVPYRGMPQATQDVVAGHIQMVFTDPSIAPPLIADGKIRPLAVSSLTRIGVLPDVPTMSEAGLKDFEAISWHMIVAPAGTPKPIVDRLNAAFRTITTSDEFKKQTTRMGLDAVPTPAPDEVRRYLDSEIARWGQLVKDVGLAGTQ